MAKEESLVLRLYRDPLLIELARRINYVGFEIHLLAEKLKSLAEGYGARRLSVALQEIASFEGCRVMLNKTARPLCYQLLGPPPEKQVAFWQNVTPDNRPQGWDSPPEIPQARPDPIMQSLVTYSVTQLDTMLREAWAKRKSPQEHTADLAREQIPRIESEMLRRGEKIPIELPEEPEKAKEPQKRKRAKKAS